MLNNKGQNITEFAILLAVIVVVGIIAYTLLGNQINQLFSGSKKKVDDYKPFGVAFNSDGSKIAKKGGDLGGTPSKPVTKCNGNTCTIDYGDFLLTGVPSDFDDYMQSSGSSGGTDQLADLMEQIADQLHDKGDIDGSIQFKDLANLTHFLAEGQQILENKAQSCLSSDYNCLNGKFSYVPYTLNLPANLQSLLPNYDPNPYFNPYLNSTDIGAQRYFKENAYVNHLYKPDAAPGAAFVAKYDTISKMLSDTKYSTALKDVTKQLYKQVARIQENVIHNMTVTKGPSTDSTYDPLTGNFTNTNITQQECNNLTGDLFVHPEFSDNIDLKAQLICINGNFTDTGSACN